MRISDLAATTGLPIDTIRFYEKRRLLDGEHMVRTANGYRDYREAAIQRLQLIRQAKAAGFTLAEIGEVVGAWEQGDLNDQVKRDLLSRKIEEVKHRIADLESVQAYLEHKLHTTVEE